MLVFRKDDDESSNLLQSSKSGDNGSIPFWGSNNKLDFSKRKHYTLVMTHTEKANLIAYLASGNGPARFYLRWPFRQGDPMGAAIVFKRDGAGDHLIVTNGPTPKCKIQSWDVTDAPVEALIILFEQAGLWHEANSCVYD